MTHILASEQLTPEETHRFTIVDKDEEQRSAVLVSVDDGVRGWINRCTHWKAPLDHGDGAKFRDGNLICQSHGARFDPGSGDCMGGPCDGEGLERVRVACDDGSVVLTDERYELAKSDV